MADYGTDYGYDYGGTAEAEILASLTSLPKIMEYKFIPDKYTKAESIAEKGGYYISQVNGHVNRNYSSATTSMKYSCCAFTKSFSDGIHFSAFSISGNTSGYWLHAITKIQSYNKLIKYDNYFTITGMRNLISFNIPKNNFGDRLKLGSLRITLTSNEIFSSISGIDEVTLGSDPIWDIFPFFTTNNEAIISNSAYSNSAVIGNIKGKLFPTEGFGIIWSPNNFSTTGSLTSFINSISSVSWVTEILHTELQIFALKKPFQLNYSRNPSALKSLCSLTSGYSYGRDSLTASTNQYIDSVSAFNTYATTISFYNDKDECLVVSKLSKPIRLIKELPYSFRTIIDLNIK